MGPNFNIYRGFTENFPLYREIWQKLVITSKTRYNESSGSPAYSTGQGLVEVLYSVENDAPESFSTHEFGVSI